MTEPELIKHLASVVTTQQELIANFRDVLRNQENWQTMTLLHVAHIVGLTVVDGNGPGPTLAALPAAVQAVVDERNTRRLGISGPPVNAAFPTTDEQRI